MEAQLSKVAHLQIVEQFIIQLEAWFVEQAQLQAQLQVQ